MSRLSEKLAYSLSILKKLQDNKGSGIIRSGEISRTHRERLIQNGFLKYVIKGWYISKDPDERPVDTTSWFVSFWEFCSEYLNNRYEDKWVISPDQSLSLHGGNFVVPHQLIIYSPEGQNHNLALLYNTSIIDIKQSLPDKRFIMIQDGLRLYSLAYALIKSSGSFFSNNPVDAKTALSLIGDSSEILGPLLDGGHSTIAGRLAGAFRNIGRENIADDIMQTFIKAGYDIRETDPFKTQELFEIPTIIRSPYVGRLHIMWQKMRNDILGIFPPPPGLPESTTTYMTQVDEAYQHDAYHSLSIEGYRVSPELIERVRSGAWDPSDHKPDGDQVDAMAARGYYLAFQSVKKSISKVLQGVDSGDVAFSDHRTWYREMFAPSVTAGILQPADLAGYRNGPVFIKNSMHVPPSANAARDAMPTFFELLSAEPDPAVRIILGHFVFVYIHPYPDGNGRIARFLMNVLLASGGYPWTVIQLEDRNQYMEALEEASVGHNIVPFTKFIAGLVSENMQGK